MSLLRRRFARDHVGVRSGEAAFQTAGHGDWPSGIRHRPERVLAVRLDKRETTGRETTRGETTQGETVKTVAYVVDRGHEQYAGALDPAHASAVVRGAIGQSGNNEDYVLSTLEHLQALGIRDHWLEDVATRIAPL